MNDKFVTNKNFEFKMENTILKIDDNKDNQMAVNDNMTDKFDVAFQRIDNLVSETVTHDNLSQKLEKYPTLARFIVVEDALDNYVTKMSNAKDKEENQSTFDRLFGLLNSEYYKGKLIDSKLDALKTTMETEYALLSQLAAFEEETKKI